MKTKTGLKNRNLISHLLLICLLVGAVPIALHVSSQNVSAAPDTHTWDGGGGDALASTGANWDQGDTAPEAGDSVIIATGSKAVNWDLAITLGAYTQSTTYSGTVTPSVNFGTSGAFTVSAGVFTAGSTTITCNGNWDTSGGTFNAQGSTVVMPTSGITIKTDGGYGTCFRNLQLTAVSGTYTLLSTVILSDWGTFGRLTGAGATISQANGLVVYYSGATPGLSGTITITGVGTLGLYLPASCTVVSTTGWMIQTPVTIASSGGTFDATMNGAITTTGALTFGAMNLDSTTSNYNVTANGITTSATWNARGSTITCSGNWDSSAGTFTAGTSTLVMTGTSKTIKTAVSGGQPYNLNISGTVTTLSNLNVTNNLTIDSGKTLTLGSGKTLVVSNEIINNGAIYQAGNVIEIIGTSPTPLNGYGIFDGNLYLNSSAAVLYADIGPSMPGYLHSNKQTRLTNVAGQYLEFSPDGIQDVNITGLVLSGSPSWTARSTGEISFTISGLQNGMRYYVVLDGSREYQLKTNDAGQLTFIYSGPWSEHTFALEKYDIWGPINDLSSAFLYLTVVICFVILLLLMVKKVESRGGKNGD